MKPLNSFLIHSKLLDDKKKEAKEKKEAKKKEAKKKALREKKIIMKPEVSQNTNKNGKLKRKQRKATLRVKKEHSF